MRLLDSIINKKYLSPSKTNLIKNLYWASLGKVCNLASGLIVGIIVAIIIITPSINFKTKAVPMILLLSVTFLASSLTSIESKPNTAIV